MRLPKPGRFRRYLVLLAAMFCLTWPSFAAIEYLRATAACGIGQYSSNMYIGVCNTKQYGDFEHEAFYFGLRNTEEGIRAADVLFFGDSRVQFAFSRSNVVPWFAERHARFFLMGFGYGEGSRFAVEVIRRHPSRPKIIVINATPWFEKDFLSEPAAFIIDHPISAFLDGHFKSALQSALAATCGLHISLVRDIACNGSSSIMRSTDTGQWAMPGFNDFNFHGPHPVTYGSPPSAGNLSAWLDDAALQASDLMRLLSGPCVVVTDTPHDGPPNGVFAKALADRLHVYFVAPEVQGLRTLDTLHLDARSAIAWSDAFLELLDPIGRACGAW